MRLNNNATKSLLATVILLIAAILLRVVWSVSFVIYAPIMIIVGTIGLFFVVYYQKTGKPICKNCNHKMHLQNKKLINQDEEVRYGQFVFTYKYEYEYVCSNCNNVVNINKIVKK